MASRKPSYRRNRDYSKSFKWTYDHKIQIGSKNWIYEPDERILG